MGRDVKQASFRLNADDTDRFKAFCEESEMTAAQGFGVLMEIMELDRAGKALPTRRTEIENFEQLTKSMISAYLHSLELNENAENRIREQFAAQLESNARTITDYQEQVSTLQIQLEEAMDFAEAYRVDLQAAQDSIDESNKLRVQAEQNYAALKEEKDKQLIDKENIIAMLTDKLMAVESKAEGYDELEAQNLALRASLSDAKQTIRNVKKDTEIERERLLKDAEISLERAVREAERILEAEHKKELNRLRSQNTELLQTITSSERSFNERIRSMDKTNADLREIVAGLKAQIPKNKNKD